jgi:hypothetical protein
MALHFEGIPKSSVGQTQSCEIVHTLSKYYAATLPVCHFKSLGSTDQRKEPASLSLFLKNEKILAFLYLGKRPEYRPYWPQAQISNRGRAYTQAILLYFKHSMCTFTEASYSPLTNSHHFARATIQQARR